MKKVHIPSSEYHKIKAASSSSLEKLRNSEAEFVHSLINEEKREQSYSMLLGEALHCLVLTPELFGKDFLVIPEGISKVTKEGKAYYASIEADTRTRLKFDLAEKANNMAEAILSVTKIRGLVNHPDSEKEASFFWKDEKTAVDCKSRLDLINPSLKIILDIKTTSKDVDAISFSKTIADFYYDRQASFYVDTANKFYNCNDFVFCFVVVSTSMPHDVNLFICDERLIDVGREIYKEDLLQYKDVCNRVNAGLIVDTKDLYQNKVFTTVSLPEWATNTSRR